MTGRAFAYISRCLMLVKMSDGPELDDELAALDAMWNSMTDEERVSIAAEPAEQ